MPSSNPIRRQLTTRQGELADRLARIRRDRARAGAPLPRNPADRASATENDEVLERLDAATAMDLRQVEHALIRLEQGQYGICEVCGFGIETGRLAILPQATTCASCSRLPDAGLP